MSENVVSNGERCSQWGIFGSFISKLGGIALTFRVWGGRGKGGLNKTEIYEKRIVNLEQEVERLRQEAKVHNSIK